MSTIEKAIALAAEAHAGQVDKAGVPYVFHVLKVMFRVTSNEEQIAAALHDIVEDTTVSFEDLLQHGFSESVVEAVDALTKRDGESRIDAAKRAAINPIARMVKLADNAENMDPSRISNPTSKDYARVNEYKKVRQVLLAHD